MIRNFVTGIVVGGVVAAGGLAVVSQMAAPPGGIAASEAEAEAVQVPAVDPVQADKTVKAGKTGSEDVALVAPSQPAAAEITLDPAKSPDAVAEPAPLDVTASKGDAVLGADVAASDAAVDPAVDPAAQGLAEVKPEVGAETPALVAPDSTALPAVTAEVDAAPAAPSPAVLGDTGAADALPAVTDAPEAAVEPAAPTEPNEALLNPAPAGDSGAAADMTLDPAPDAALPKVLDPTKDAADAGAKVIVLAPSAGLEKTVDGVTIGRLPSISAAPKAADGTEAAAGGQVGGQSDAAAVPDDRPLAKFAAAFNNDAAKPLFSVLLVDSGAADLDRASLAALPFAVTFVIDPLDPSAAAAEKIYRDGGKEVVMLASGIPAGAQASDLEQTFQANGAVLEQAVAVMDVGAGGFQDNRPLATMVVPLIKEQGRGLLTYDKGLNAADQVARRNEVASALIFSDLDAANEPTAKIRRYLDRAAFKAAQDGRVVVVGSTRPETIAALMEWTVEGRGASVAMAPISAVLAVK